MKYAHLTYNIFSKEIVFSTATYGNLRRMNTPRLEPLLCLGEMSEMKCLIIQVVPLLNFVEKYN